MLGENLQSCDAARLLREAGDPVCDETGCIRELGRRLTDREDFPREIGLFLRCSPEDYRTPGLRLQMRWLLEGLRRRADCPEEVRAISAVYELLSASERTGLPPGAAERKNCLILPKCRKQPIAALHP